MSQSPLRLYVDSLFTSPYAMSVFVTLREKACPSIWLPWIWMRRKTRPPILPGYL